MYCDHFPQNSPDDPENLVRPCDVKGILHSHSRYTDGSHTLDCMVETARDIGLAYLGISDHFQTPTRPSGLDLQGAQIQRQEIELLREKYDGFDILQGVQVDADVDGNLPLADDILKSFDYVIVSFSDDDRYDPEALTERVVTAASLPLVNIISSPVGECMVGRGNGALDMTRILDAAARHNTAVEINANPACLDLDWTCCRRAQDMGVYISISPNAHRAARLVDFRHGAELASDAGLCCRSILNTLSVKQLRSYLANGTRP